MDGTCRLSGVRREHEQLLSLKAIAEAHPCWSRMRPVARAKIEIG